MRKKLHVIRVDNLNKRPILFMTYLGCSSWNQILFILYIHSILCVISDYVLCVFDWMPIKNIDILV